MSTLNNIHAKYTMFEPVKSILFSFWLRKYVSAKLKANPEMILNPKGPSSLCSYLKGTSRD